MAPDLTNAARIDPGEQIPEADLLEQQVPLDPPLTNDEYDWPEDAASAEPVDEADRWDQQRPVPSIDDDYPHHNPVDVEAG